MGIDFGFEDEVIGFFLRSSIDIQSIEPGELIERGLARAQLVIQQFGEADGG